MIAKSRGHDDLPQNGTGSKNMSDIVTGSNVVGAGEVSWEFREASGRVVVHMGAVIGNDDRREYLDAGRSGR